MADPHPPLTEDELLCWSAELREREDALAAEQARFDAYVTEFQRRARQIEERKAKGLMDAFAQIRRAFPDGLNLRIEPSGPQPGGMIH